MRPAKKIVVIAGEESGDIHAASFIQKLKIRLPDIQVSGIGGRHMQNAGVDLISDLARFGVTGISEVIRHLKVIKKAFKDMQAHLEASRPDLLILVDYPGFNLRLAKFAKEVLGIRILYYISPQIWAWKAGRIHTIRQYIDHMAVILPFEKELYQKAQVNVSFVGHPLVDTTQDNKNIHTLRAHLNIPLQKTVIALLPGSRTHEVERHLPMMVKSAEILVKENNNLHFVIPVASTINANMIHSYFHQSSLSYSLTYGKTVETASASDCIVVSSGTASLECALIAKPMCIIYKASLLTYLAASKFIKVKYLGLCNLLQNEMMVPELLQYDCNPTELAKTINTLLTDDETIQRITKKLTTLKHALSSQEADISISALIERELQISHIQ